MSRSVRYEEGVIDRSNHKRYDDNPYGNLTMEGIDWLEGWKAADIVIEGKDREDSEKEIDKLLGW